MNLMLNGAFCEPGQGQNIIHSFEDGPMESAHLLEVGGAEEELGAT